MALQTKLHERNVMRRDWETHVYHSDPHCGVIIKLGLKQGYLHM